jgi:hypothetical protein
VATGNYDATLHFAMGRRRGGGSTSLAKDVEGDKQATTLPIMGLSGTHPPSEVDVLAPWPV